LKKSEKKRVILTTTYSEYKKISKIARRYGLIPYFFGCIKIKFLKFKIPDKKYDWVIFTSKNGVDAFFKRVQKGYLKEKKIAAIGAKTADEIKKIYGKKPDFVPNRFNSKDFFEEFKKRYRLKGLNLLIVTSDISDNFLKDSFIAEGSCADKIVAYKTLRPKTDISKKKRLVKNIKNSFIVFSSPSAFKNFIDMVGRKILKDAYVIPIGLKTNKTMDEYGIKSFFIPQSSTFDCVFKSLKDCNF
jgi:uroporphyrinogen-III synthase